MQIDEILPFEHDLSKTADHFSNQNISMNSVDLWEIIKHKTR